MGKISTYFTLEEFQARSQYTLTPALVTKATWMARNVGDPARAHFGRPLYMTSFARAVKPATHSSAGKPDNGAHSTGDGGDWDMPGVSSTALANWMAENLLDHGIIWAVIDEGDHVHTTRSPVAGATAGYLRSKPGSGEYTFIRAARTPGSPAPKPTPTTTPTASGGKVATGGTKPGSLQAITANVGKLSSSQPTTVGGSIPRPGGDEAPRGGGLGVTEFLLGGAAIAAAYLWWRSAG